jgi:hypothetical protein
VRCQTANLLCAIDCEQLHETVDLLVSVNDHQIDTTLMRRASALISWLSAEIDELALYATGDEPQVHA